MAIFVPLTTVTNRDKITTKDRSPVGVGAVTGPKPDGGGPSAPPHVTTLAELDGADDLRAIEALASTGFPARTAADSWALRTLTAPAAGLMIANPAGVAGNPTFALANDLAALEALSTTGYAKRTGSDTWALSSTLPWSDIASTPTTLAGYGITNGQPLATILTSLSALSNAAGVLTNDGSGGLSWAASSGGIGGSTGSTDNALLRADGTGGATLQGSAAYLTDLGELLSPAFESITGSGSGYASFSLTTPSKRYSIALGGASTSQPNTLFIIDQSASAIRLSLADGGLLSLPGYTYNSSFRVSGFEIQGYSQQNVLFGFNSFYDGSNDVRRESGYAGRIQFVDDKIYFRKAGNASGGSSISWSNALILNGDNSVSFPVYSSGVAHFDGSGNITSSPVVNSDITSLDWSKLTSTPTTLAGYGITDAQPLDSDLTAIAALSTTSYGRSFLTQANAAAAATYIGVGTGDSPVFAGVLFTANSAYTTWQGQSALSGRVFFAQSESQLGINLLGVGTNSDPQNFFQRARGVFGALTAVQSGDFIGRLFGSAYDGSGWAGNSLIVYYATENQTTTNHGQAIGFEVTPNGSTTRSRALDILSTGIKTDNPSGGTAQPWKLGGYTAGTVTATGAVRVEINGTPYDLVVKA